MKNKLHIFYVQSPLSFLVCKAIIAHTGLEAEEVLFLTDRDFNIDTGYKTEKSPPFLSNRPAISLRKIPKNWQRQRNAKKFLHTLTKSRVVHLYINRMNQILVQNFQKHCDVHKIDIYEEGFAAYWKALDDTTVNFKKPSLRVKLIYWLSCTPVPEPISYYPDRYAQIYAATERAFKGFPRRVQLSLENTIADLGRKPSSSEVPYNAVLFALPLPYDFLRDKVRHERFVSAVCDAILAFQDRPLRFKFHPDRYLHCEYWDGFCAEVKGRTGFDMREASTTENIPLEVIAAHREDVVIAVLVSSLAVYADIFRAQVVSFAKPVFGLEHRKVIDLLKHAPNAIFIDQEDNPTGISDRLRLLSPPTGAPQ